MFGSFFLTLLTGALLLALPISAADGTSTNLLDCFFTAVSAGSVTGLTTVTTSEQWSNFGHVVIILLIQVGGLGTMSLASIIGLAVVRKLSISTRLVAATQTRTADTGIGGTANLLRNVLLWALAIESAIAVLLTLRFWLGYGHPFGESVWFGVFHAISAFNNAGFTLFPDSLQGFNTDGFILLPICAGIILGGLGFPVLMQLRRHFRVVRLWTMNTRLVLTGTLALLVLAFAFTALMEWNNPNTLGGMAWHEKLLAAFSQGVQTRTAGFDVLNGADLHPITWMAYDIFMFIGGGPGGTAGGIKITTFAVLFFIMLTEIGGGRAVNVFGKRLSRAAHREAITVVLLSMGLVISATMIIGVLSPFSLEQIMYEVCSAFGTVGLSTGITPDLPPAAQVVIMIVMFVGRMGPITFASALAIRPNAVQYELPQERPIIG